MGRVTATDWAAMWNILCRVLLFIGLARIPMPTWQVSDGNPSGPPEQMLKRFIQEYVRHKQLDDDKTTKYLYAFVDLNGDSTKEAIVYLVGRWWCGSGGCPTLILTPTGSSYRIVSSILITRPPIRMLTSVSNGWHDISVFVQGGGVSPDHEAKLSFNGKTYPGTRSRAHWKGRPS